MKTLGLKSQLVIILATALLSGCVFEGTGTGNPMLASPAMGDPAASPPSPATAADLIALQLCLTAQRCHGDWIAARCVNAIYPLTDFAPKLGVTTEPPPTLMEIRNLEIQGRLRADGPATQACLDDLKNFDCARASSEDTPATLATWLSPRCADVERPAPETRQDSPLNEPR